jgi:DNA-directed RNA polymerase subunit M/transcription elongation factor TFIIS
MNHCPICSGALIKPERTPEKVYKCKECKTQIFILIVKK